MIVEQSVIINIPPGEIFTFVSDFENLTSWSSSVISARKIASEDMLVGTMVQCTIRILGKWLDTTYEIVECVPGRYLTIKSITSIAPTLISYRFVLMEGGRTNVFVEESIQFVSGSLGFAESVIKNVINRQLAIDLLTLKDLMEVKDSICTTTG
jgi:Polyketide cyclase / dehydrase and lipid transport